MKKIIIIAAMFLSSNVIAQGYYDSYGYQPSQRQYSRDSDIRDQIMERQQNYMRNQINRDMRELEIRSNIRRQDMINGGTGNLDRGYGYRYDRY